MQPTGSLLLARDPSEVEQAIQRAFLLKHLSGVEATGNEGLPGEIGAVRLLSRAEMEEVEPALQLEYEGAVGLLMESDVQIVSGIGWDGWDRMGESLVGKSINATCNVACDVHMRCARVRHMHAKT